MTKEENMGNLLKKIRKQNWAVFILAGFIYALFCFLGFISNDKLSTFYFGIGTGVLAGLVSGILARLIIFPNQNLMHEEEISSKGTKEVNKSPKQDSEDSSGKQFDKIKIFLQYYFPWFRNKAFYERAVEETFFFTDYENKKSQTKLAKIEYEIYVNAPWLNIESIFGTEHHKLNNPEKIIKYHEYMNMIEMKRLQFTMAVLTLVLVIVTAVNVYLLFMQK